MEYVDGQLVGVRDRMPSADTAEGDGCTKVLQEVRCRVLRLILNWATIVDIYKKRKSMLLLSLACLAWCKVVLDNLNSIPDTDHPAGWVNCTTEREVLHSKITHHSVIIYDSNRDNIMTLCRLRRASGRPPDGSWYMLCTSQPSNI